MWLPEIIHLHFVVYHCSARGKVQRYTSFLSTDKLDNGRHAGAVFCGQLESFSRHLSGALVPLCSREQVSGYQRHSVKRKREKLRSPQPRGTTNAEPKRRCPPNLLIKGQSEQRLADVLSMCKYSACFAHSEHKKSFFSHLFCRRSIRTLYRANIIHLKKFASFSQNRLVIH